MQVPRRAQIDLTQALGSSSGPDLVEKEGRDKFEAYGLQGFTGSVVVKESG